MTARHVALFRDRSMRALCALAAMGMSAGCSGTYEPEATTPVKTAVVVVTPPTSSLSIGAELPLQAQAQDVAGLVVADAMIFWSSSNTDIATVSPSGVVTAKALGTVQIAASVEGKSAIATVTVVLVPVASVTVLPGTGTITAGATMQLQAVTYDAAGTILSDRPVAWATSTPLVATVDDAGNVLGIAAGTTTITATSAGKTGTAIITIEPPPAPVPVARVDLGQSIISIERRMTTDLTARVYDANGQELTGRTITWSSDQAQIASVRATGPSTARVTAGNRIGVTTISAICEGERAEVQVFVRND